MDRHAERAPTRAQVLLHFLSSHLLRVRQASPASSTANASRNANALTAPPFTPFLSFPFRLSSHSCNQHCCRHSDVAVILLILITVLLVLVLPLIFFFVLIRPVRHECASTVTTTTSPDKHGLDCVEIELARAAHSSLRTSLFW